MVGYSWVSKQVLTAADLNFMVSEFYIIWSLYSYNSLDAMSRLRKDDREIEVLRPKGAIDSTYCQFIQTGCGPQPASYAVGTGGGGQFRGDKPARREWD
jgi:hypothetical protein